MTGSPVLSTASCRDCNNTNSNNCRTRRTFRDNSNQGNHDNCNTKLTGPLERNPFGEAGLWMQLTKQEFAHRPLTKQEAHHPDYGCWTWFVSLGTDEPAMVLRAPCFVWTRSYRVARSAEIIVSLAADTRGLFWKQVQWLVCEMIGFAQDPRTLWCILRAVQYWPSHQNDWFRLLKPHTSHRAFLRAE